MELNSFSRADKANQINLGLQPLQKLTAEFSSISAFFTKLFSRAAKAAKIAGL
jgi:hypothetical protein